MLDPRTRGTSLRPVGFAPLLLLLLAAATLSAGHIQRARVYCCIPKHNYGHDALRRSATAIAVADPPITDKWRTIVPRDPKDLAAPGGRDEPYRTREIDVERKPFHLRDLSIDVDHLSLDQVGIAIYGSGDIVATGRLTHEEGPEGGRLGNNVVIRLRAFAAQPRNREAPDADSPVVWHSEQKLWISRHRSEYVSLIPEAEPHPNIRRFFADVTHIEVELEYRQDR